MPEKDATEAYSRDERVAQWLGRVSFGKFAIFAAAAATVEVGRLGGRARDTLYRVAEFTQFPKD